MGQTSITDADQSPRHSPLVDYVSGALAGSANIFVGFPFDTVKVRLQANACPYNGAWNCATAVLQQEGVRGMFRGASAPLLGGALETGVNYAVFEAALTSLSTFGTISEPVAVPAAAALAGFCLSVIVSPAELIKCRMQLGASDKLHSYSGPIDCLRQLVRSEGYRGLFRGLGATIAREVPGNAVYFGTYRGMRELLHRSNNGNNTSSNNTPTFQENPFIEALSAVSCGALSGMIMWSVVLPIDVAKTRIQTAWPGTREDVGIVRQLQLLYKEGGRRKLWSGLKPVLVRAAPANAAQWLTWELCIEAFKNRDLIRKVRQAKTAAEEREIIAKEAAALRQAFKEQDSTYRHRNVAKLMYMHMLGYPTHFGQMETLKLIASSGFPEKRIGYLGLMILLDERQEVLMLVTNSLKNDLNSRNQYIVGLALTALGNICSAEMARDLAPEVEKLLGSTNPYIRKKAALCARRVMRKVPDMLESFVDRATELLNDRNHAVILAGVTLMLEIADEEPATIAIFRDQVNLLCRILRALLNGGFSAEYDVGGIADPYLQVKILKLLRVLGHGSAEASDAMSDVLAQVATNTESSRSAGNAILYECVRTIMAVESIGGLRVLAVNTLGRFLAHRDNNIRYVALATLARIVAVDVQAVQRHRATIVECVKDSDASIRRSALELVYALVNEGNVRALCSELLDYLNVCDQEFKPDLTAKICMLVQRYAPDKKWYVDSMVRVLSEAGSYVKEEACRAVITLILNAPQLHGYAARAMYEALTTLGPAAAPSLVNVALWSAGEYGELIISGSGRLEGETTASTASEEEIVSTIAQVLERHDLPNTCREYALTALAKLSSRCSTSSADCIRVLLEEHSSTPALEEQSRSVEYARLFDHENIRGQIMEHMPAIEEAAYDATLDAVEDGGAGNGVANAAVDLAALLGLDVGVPVGEEGGGVATGGSSGGGIDALQDLLGGVSLDMPATAEVATDSIDAYSNDTLTVRFDLKKTNTAGTTDITAHIVNKTHEPITSVTLQAAVPKFMQVRLEPASNTTLAPNGQGDITQAIHVNNTMVGQKALVMRLRISYNVGGEQVVQQAEVNSFPPGY